MQGGLYAQWKETIDRGIKDMSNKIMGDECETRD